MHVIDRHKWGRNRHTVNYARRVVETVLDGPSMTDEAIKFLIDKFHEILSENTQAMEQRLSKQKICVYYFFCVWEITWK